MRYDFRIRSLARVFYGRPPALRGTRLLAQIAEALGVPDLDVTGATQLQLSTGQQAPMTVLRSPDGSWQVNSGVESIDVAWQPPPEITDTEDAVTEFLQRAVP